MSHVTVKLSEYPHLFLLYSDSQKVKCDKFEKSNKKFSFWPRKKFLWKIYWKKTMVLKFFKPKKITAFIDELCKKIVIVMTLDNNWKVSRHCHDTGIFSAKLFLLVHPSRKETFKAETFIQSQIF